MELGIETPVLRRAPHAVIPAVTVSGIGKSFHVPHGRPTSLKERASESFRRVHHRTFPALQDVSFGIGRGEFFGVVGRNGSGKSTLLKVIAGIYNPDAGAVQVAGRLSPFIEMGVGFNPELTARDNVMLNGAILGLTRRELRERFDDIIAFAELEDFVELELKNFSSGMTVRLAFSMAIQVEADIIIVDEVLAVGDSSFQVKCYDQFERLKREGRTVIFVSHDMGSIARFCDRALLLDGGRMVEIGPPATIAAHYEQLNRQHREQRARGEPPREESRPSNGSLRSRTPAFAGIDVPATYRPYAVGEDLRRFASLTLTFAKAQFRLHYHGSALGYLWSVMRPLLLFTVMYLIFSRAAGFAEGVHHYTIYLLSGIVLWMFFTEATSGAMMSLVNNESLMRKMRFPRMAIPLSAVLKAFFNLGANAVAVVVWIALSGVAPRLTWLEIPVLVAVLAVIAVGLGMALSTLQVRYRDTQQLWSVAQQLLFYSSPILYVAQHYPGPVKHVLAFSPIAAVLTEMRHAVVDPSAPSAAATVGGAGFLFVPLAIAVGCFMLGAWLFCRDAPKIAERV